MKSVWSKNKNKIKLIENEKAEINAIKLQKLKDKEENLLKLIIKNTVFLFILRLPEIIALYYHIKLNIYYSKLSYYYDIGKINELFDFLFTLHPVFQFILFYSHNRAFIESFHDKFLSKRKKIIEKLVIRGNIF